jgi:polysaccharide biosynthesis protein PslH
MGKDKLLIITSRFPLPTDKGDKLRAFEQIKQLSIHFDLILFSLSTEKVNVQSIESMKQYCIQLHIQKLSKIVCMLNVLKGFLNGLPFQVNYFYKKSIKRKIQALINAENINKVYCQLVRTSAYVSDISIKQKSLDYMDALSLGMSRRIGVSPWYMKPFVRMEAERLKTYEKRMSQVFDQAYIITQNDLNAMVPLNCPVSVAPNGVQVLKWDKQVFKKYEIAFTGNMSYPPNVDAALYLIKSIMPLVWQQWPEAKLVIAGTSPHSSILSAQNNRVIVTGKVDDIHPYYLQSEIFVAPMRIGSGLQNKLLEAMSAQMPCVTTSLANDALQAIAGQDLLIGNTNSEIAAAILEIHKNKTLQMQLSENGYNFVKSNYSWEKNTQVIINYFKKQV